MALIGPMKYLTIGGSTYEIPIGTTTDENMKWTASTSTNTYYPLQSTSTATTGTANTLNSISFYQYYNTAGGYRRLILGNTTNYTSTGGAYGTIRLYGTGATYYGDLNPGTIGSNSLTANRTWTLPNETGTVLLGTLNYTTSGNNRAVQKDSSGNLYVVQKDDNTTYSVAVSGTAGLVRPWKSYSGNSSGPTATTGTTAPTVNAITNTAGKYYAVEMDATGRMFVNVPWSAGDDVPGSTGSSTTGITASTTATKTTLGTASSVTGVQSSTTTASKVTISGSNSFSATVTSHVLSFSHSAQSVSASDVTVPIKNTSSTSVPNVSVASATVTITDPGHTHTI